MGKKAKEILRDSMPSSLLQTDDGYSFLQLATSSSNEGNNVIDAVQILRQLAKQERSSVLAQLASRAETTLMHARRTNEDPFAKISQMISEMISSREAQVNRD